MKLTPRLPSDGINVTPTNPLWDAVTLAMGVSLVVVVLVAAGAFFVESLVLWLPVEVEQAIFSKVGDVWDSSREGEADSRESTINEILSKLREHWPDAPYEFLVGIEDSDQPNAMALPGGLIIVTSALIDNSQSANEIAFVLGHELGHFHNRDHLRGIGRNLVLGAVSLAIGTTGANSFLPTLLEMVGVATGRHFDRKQELAADAFGLELVHATYGHVAGATGFFEKIKVIEAEQGNLVGAYWATHPMSEKRIERVHGLAVDNGWSSDGELVPLPW